ncbi:glycine cleavage system protein GcvH [Glutamicibacter sp. JL.03c]|uniref:glycine cleavage system protein GcvH n=1 Tax=Glutamicibacter sp. JL.03c TaxID=2984842 RepID=UPI0021F6B281|nr:glycine cleavage system protein GcvH [Glutamicibacter sp. JL.03c]UYQ76840.1 glycine cleavage system protein GcvH [Glutamicibacter sp. JL.03c]
MSKVLSSLRYSAEHEWIDASSPAKVGITQIAADALGDVVYVDLPEVGDSVSAGETCGEVESTKSVSDLYSPVTGTVVAVNDEAVDNPAILNEDPYGAGWLFTVEVTEEGPLLSAVDYASANGGDVQ